MEYFWQQFVASFPDPSPDKLFQRCLLQDMNFDCMKIWLWFMWNLWDQYPFVLIIVYKVCIISKCLLRVSWNIIQVFSAIDSREWSLFYLFFCWRNGSRPIFQSNISSNACHRFYSDILLKHLLDIHFSKDLWMLLLGILQLIDLLLFVLFLPILIHLIQFPYRGYCKFIFLPLSFWVLQDLFI